jgi:hypothetical protein
MGSRITPLTATRDTFLLDARTIEANLGVSHGGVFNIKYGRNYKRQLGQSWKAALIEDWDPSKNGGDPRNLECLFGLEISPCTENARRVSLSSIIVSEAMRPFFDPAETNDFMQALEPRRQEQGIIKRLWDEKPEWRKNIRSSVYASLRALRDTGYIDRRAFYALWNPVGDHIPMSKVSFERCGWMKLLSDSPETGCMAIISDQCLEARFKKGRQCQSFLSLEDRLENRSTLQTSIIVDQDNPPRGLNVYGNNWLVTSESVGSVYSMGSTGGIKVKAILLDQEIRGLQTDWIQTTFSFRERRRAYESTGDIPDTRPLRVLVQ